MEVKNYGKILYTILFALVVIFFFAAIYELFNPSFGATTFLSGISTFVLAFLTVFYVLTTSKQLNVMNKQLEEMQRSRELQDQPLPWISNAKVLIQKPRLYFRPPNQHPMNSRYHAFLTFRNLSSSPAVCIDVTARILIPQNDSENIVFDADSIRIDALEEKQFYPQNQDQDSSFVFEIDNNSTLLQSLRNKKLAQYPQLLVAVAYRNVLGGCFVLYNAFMLYPKKDDENIIINWLNQITTFPINFKNEIETLSELGKEPKREKWRELFDVVKAKVAELVLGENIVLKPVAIPGAFRVETISFEEYQKNAEEIKYHNVHCSRPLFKKAEKDIKPADSIA